MNLHSIVCLNVKELFAWSRRHNWSLSDSHKNRTHNHLVCKRTLKHLAKLVKWLSCVVSTYLCNAFDCTFLSRHVGVSMRKCLLALRQFCITTCKTKLSRYSLLYSRRYVLILHVFESIDVNTKNKKNSQKYSII